MSTGTIWCCFLPYMTYPAPIELKRMDTSKVVPISIRSLLWGCGGESLLPSCLTGAGAVMSTPAALIRNGRYGQSRRVLEAHAERFTVVPMAGEATSRVLRIL